MVDKVFNYKDIDVCFFDNYDKNIRRIISMNKRNVIVKDVKHLELLVEDAIINNANKALHLGIIDKNFISNIRKNIKNLPFSRKNYLNKDNYDLVINQSEIRHLLKDKNKITREDVLNYVKLLPSIIVNCNYISYTKAKEEGLRFKAFIDGNTYISFVLVSNKKRTLTAKSIFMEKNDFEAKKRNVSPTNDV